MRPLSVPIIKLSVLLKFFMHLIILNYSNWIYYLGAQNISFSIDSMSKIDTNPSWPPDINKPLS